MAGAESVMGADNDGASERGTTEASFDARTQMLIAEFNKMREEQFGRTTAQQGLLAVNLTGGAGFIAFAASTLNAPENQFMLAVVLLLLPLFSSALALAYCEQHYSIMKVALYLSLSLERRAREAAATADVFLWHAFLINYRDVKVDDLLGRRWRRTFAVYMPACFYSPSVVAIAVALIVLVQNRSTLELGQALFASALAALAIACMVFVVWLWNSSTKRIDAMHEDTIDPAATASIKRGVEEMKRSARP